MQTFTPESINPEPFSPGEVLYDSARRYLGEPFDALQEAASNAFLLDPPCYLEVAYSQGTGLFEMDSLDTLANALRSPWFVRKVGRLLDILVGNARPLEPDEPPFALSIRFGLLGQPPVAQLVMPAA